MTPSQLEQLPEQLVKLFSDLELDIMKDIVRRIRINSEITGSADWQINKLYQLGQSSDYIKQSIREQLNLSEDAINTMYKFVLQEEYVRDKALYESAGSEVLPYEDNAEIMMLVEAIKRQTKEELSNMTQSMGFALNQGNKTVAVPLMDHYRNVLDNAIMQISTGAFDYSTVIKKTVNEMTKSGIRTIDYESGWSNRIEVATRRAVMTGITQLTGKINDMNAEALGTDTFEVDWHFGARNAGTGIANHQDWQGKWYTREELKSVCGLGEVTGLLGANCYHIYYPVIPGISKPKYTLEALEEMKQKENAPTEYNGKDYTSYEAIQKQRKLETLMRKQRQDITLLKEGGADKDEIGAARSRYRSTMAHYIDFSKKMGLPQQRDRVYMDGLGKV